MNFVIFGLQPWDIPIGSNCKNIAEELSINHKVLYVNAPLSLKTALKDRKDPKVKKRLKRLRFSAASFEEVNENLWVYYPDCMVLPINGLKVHFFFKLLNRVNNSLLGRSIRKAIQHMGFDQFYLFNDNSMFLGYHLQEELRPKKSIYYMRDHLTKNRYWAFHGSKLEPQLITKSDLVVTNSVFYMEYAQEYNKASFMIGQGCDISVLGKVIEKVDFPELVGPVIGYLGAIISIRLSIELLEQLATLRPNWNLVLIGPEDEAFKNSKLHEFGNVYFLGPVSPDTVASYVQCFDVCINPQEHNEETVGNYPRKIDEYLYLGKPVVATYTKAMEYFEDHVSLAEDAEGYVKAIEKELKENDTQKIIKRREFASTHTWANSVSAMLEKLNYLN